MTDSNVKKPGLIKRLSRFITETKSELKKAVWPSKKQLLHNTGVILVFIVIVTVILFALDSLFAGGFSLLNKLN